MSEFVGPQAVQEDLLLALVDLTEIIDALGGMVRAETDARAAQNPVPATEVAVVRFLLNFPDSSIAQIGTGLKLPPSAARGAVKSLERRGLAEQSPSEAGHQAGGNSTRQQQFRATPAGRAIRSQARQLAERQLNLALTSMRNEDRVQLSKSAEALTALAVALGFRSPKEPGA